MRVRVRARARVQVYFHVYIVSNHDTYQPDAPEVLPRRRPGKQAGGGRKWTAAAWSVPVALPGHESGR